jgi:arylsulfatase A-like enzyme
MPDRPNIVVLHCHDLGNLLRCYGADNVRSPNLDRFAEEGVRFSRSYCSAPQCSPSRASLFTGRWPHSNGVMGLCHPPFRWDLHDDERHLASFLSDAGYATAGIGMVHETHHDPAARCGYQRYDRERRASAASDVAIARLEEFAGDPARPFYLYAGYLEPHRLPSDPNYPYMGFLSGEFGPDTADGVYVPGFLRDEPGSRVEMAELQGAVRHVDTHAGRVFDAIDRLGLRDNTLVVFTTDHGYAMPRAKCTLYDPGIAVALLMRLPGRDGWHGGRVVEEMVQNVDFLPTVLDLAGIPVPENVQGRGFAPLLDGRAYTPHDAIFAELTYHDYYHPMRAIRTETHKLIVNFSTSPAYMDCSQSWRPRAEVRTPPNRAMAYNDAVELYDLRDDPWEQENLASVDAPSDVQRDLLRRLRAHLEATGDPILHGPVPGPAHRRAMGLLDGA